MAVTAAEIEQQIHRIHMLREMQATYRMLQERACVMIDQAPRNWGWRWRECYGGANEVVKEVKQRIQDLEAEEQRILKSPVHPPEP